MSFWKKRSKQEALQELMEACGLPKDQMAFLESIASDCQAFDYSHEELLGDSIVLFGSPGRLKKTPFWILGFPPEDEVMMICCSTEKMGVFAVERSDDGDYYVEELEESLGAFLAKCRPVKE